MAMVFGSLIRFVEKKGCHNIMANVSSSVATKTSKTSIALISSIYVIGREMEREWKWKDVSFISSF